MSPLLSRFLMLLTCALCLVGGEAQSREKELILASTTSTENSGLFDHILPRFTAATGITVRVIARGTGQALRMAQDGDADALLVHHRPSEDQFVADGHGLFRRDVMSNDFVIIGPASDPAGIAGMEDPASALNRIAEVGAIFASRGDDSGTHRREVDFWVGTGVSPAESSGEWYRETGAGMGATLNAAVAMGAYTLTDRATWLAFQNKGDLKILVEDHHTLKNHYGVIVVHPERHPHINVANAKSFVDWLTGPDGQDAIASFRVAEEQVFFPHQER